MTTRSAAAGIASLLLALLADGVGGAAKPGAAALVSGREGQELAELVAVESFKSFGKSTENTILARFASLESKDPLGVWVYERGAVRPAPRERFDQAGGGDRSRWPPYTLIFVTFPEGGGRLRLELSVRYDQGLTPESRGGYEETWHLRRVAERWTVVRRELTLNVD